MAVGDGIDEGLEADARPAVLGRVPGGDRREVRPRRVPGHGEALRVAAELVGVRADPGEGGARVLRRRRERVLGREPVAHVDDDRLGRVGQRAADAVEGLDRAHHPPAAVEVGDHGQRPGRGDGPRRVVDAVRIGVARAPGPPGGDEPAGQ